MKIWHISDTHTYHHLLTPPEGIDMVIFSGDCSNPRELYLNEPQVREFIRWYFSLNIKYKIFVAGNHDTSIEKGYINKMDFESNGIIYLENDFVEIEGLKIWGSPVTPTFGHGWAFNKNRSKLHDLWSNIPDDTDIVITHVPPQTILDVSYKLEGHLEYCGCLALLKRMKKIEPKLCLFGHIHDNVNNLNSGVRMISNCKTIFSNGSVVTDGKFGALSSNGNIFTI